MTAETPLARAAGLTPRERFLGAALRKPVDGPPVWIMRQAGRYLPEYRDFRSRTGFLEMVRTPDLAAEVTCQPVRRFGMDAAVIFSDILVPVAAMGLEVRFEEGAGPKVSPPVRALEDVRRLAAFDPEIETGFVGETIRRVRRALGPDVAILGFAGAPFTTASYMIEGGSSRDFAATKSLLYGEPATLREVVDLVVDCLVPYLGMQVAAGADALQLFDSWGGALDASTYREALFPSMERLICAVKALGVPVILYVNGCAHLLEVLADCGPTVVGVDWRVDPRDARRRIGDRVALQGNLDPAVLLGPPEEAGRRAAGVIDAFGPEPGYIFNLGSGIQPSARVESVAAVVAAVKSRRPA